MTPPFQIQYTSKFEKFYSELPNHKKDAFDQAVDLLVSDPRSHSLNLKKMRGTKDIWEARINGGYRLTMTMQKGILKLRKVGTHPTLQNP